MNADKERLIAERAASLRYRHENFSREENYLLMLQNDLQKGFSAISQIGIAKADYVCEHWRDFGFETQSKCQLYFDFVFDFQRLQKAMKEFSWSKEFLKENGIDFPAIKKLYYAVA